MFASRDCIISEANCECQHPNYRLQSILVNVKISAMERKKGYQVLVYTRRLPESFKGPQIVRKVLSHLSEAQNGSIGGRYPGMSIEDAERLAEDSNSASYVDLNGHLRSSRGVVVRVS